MATTEATGAITRTEDRGMLPVLDVIDMYGEWGGITAAREAVARAEAQGQPAMIVKDWQRERLYVKPLALPEVPAAMDGTQDVADFARRLLQVPAQAGVFGKLGELDDIGGRVLWLTRLADGTVVGVLDTGSSEIPVIADGMDFAEAAGWAQKSRVQLSGRVVNVEGLLVLDLRRDSLASASSQELTA